MSTYSTSRVDAAGARRGPRSVLAIALVALLSLMGAVDAQDEVTLQGPAAPPATPSGAAAETDGQGAPPTATDLASTGRSSTVDPLTAVGLLALGLLLLVARGRRRRSSGR